MFGKIDIVTPATGSAVALADVKDHLRVEHAEEDSKIQNYITAATSAVEDYCGISVLSKTLRARFDGFDTPLILRRGPVTAVNSVTYRDRAGKFQTFPNFDWDPSETRARVAPKRGHRWPVTDGNMGAVRVEYVAGRAGNDVKPNIVHALKLLVAHYYENNGPVNIGNITSELEFTLTALLRDVSDLVMD